MKEGKGGLGMLLYRAEGTGRWDRGGDEGTERMRYKLGMGLTHLTPAGPSAHPRSNRCHVV